MATGATRAQTAPGRIGPPIGRIRDSGRAPTVDACSDTNGRSKDRTFVSKGRSFLMSESTTAASRLLAGSFPSLANSAPPTRISTSTLFGRYGARTPVRKAVANQDVRNLAAFTARQIGPTLPLWHACLGT